MSYTLKTEWNGDIAINAFEFSQCEPAWFVYIQKDGRKYTVYTEDHNPEDLNFYPEFLFTRKKDAIAYAKEVAEIFAINTTEELEELN